MKEELDALKVYLNILNEYTLFDLKFYQAKLNNIECILVESGIGKVNAARTTQILIDNIKVDYIFNIGVAGGVDDEVSICDIVVATNLVQHDFDITAFNHEKGYIPNVGKYIPCDEYLLKLAESVDKDLKFGTIASGDIFCTEIAMGNKINSKFNALCVEMEGASIAQVCYLCHIPFLIIRSISDTLNGNNQIAFDKFLSISSKKVAEIMIKLISRLDIVE